MPKKYKKKQRRVIFHWKYGRVHFVLIASLISAVVQSIVAYQMDMMHLTSSLVLVMSITGAVAISQVEFSLDAGELLYHRLQQSSERNMYVFFFVIVGIAIGIEIGFVVMYGDIVYGLGLAAIFLAVAALVIRMILHFKYHA